MVSKKHKHSKKELAWGRFATSAIFFIIGVAVGSWLGRIPDIQKSLHLNEATLGVVLLVSAVGGLLAMQPVPKLISLFGHRLVLGVIAPLYPLSLIGITLASDATTLAIALFIFGGAGSMLSVVVNTHAVDVEFAYERAIMSSFHALFSAGSLLGAGAAGLLAGKGFSPAFTLTAAAIALMVLALAIIPKLLPVAHADPKKIQASMDTHATHHHKRAWWKGVILIGSLAFVGYMAEGAIADWSAVFMRDQHHAGPTLAVAAYVAFSICMTIGRVLGDAAANALGKVQTVRYGAFLAATGLFIGIIMPSSFAAIIGFAIAGCGLAVLVPILFSIAGSLAGGESHAAVARVSTIAVFGLLLGPAVIGGIAHHATLTVALLVPCALLLYVGSIAPHIRKVTRQSVRM